MKSVGLKTIAFELNVSVNTVSRALRDCDDISEETKIKVRQKAYELGYMPNNISQFIKRDGKNLISVVVNSFHNLYFTVVCEKLISLFKEKNYDFSLVYTSEKTLTTNVIKQCISQRTDAIITLLEPTDEAVDVAKLNNIPIVIVGRTISNEYVDEVFTDDELGGKLAANYLVNFHKCNKLIYIKIPNVECSKRRQDSFVKTINELLPNSSDVKILSVNQIESNLLNLINQGYLGVFCFNDETVYECLKILNKDIPNIRKINPKLHFIGYDSLSIRINGLMDVTSIDFDYDAICNSVFEIVKNKIKDKSLPKQSIEFTVKLHQRKYF
jgi:LacI family transcriptional regulator